MHYMTAVSLEMSDEPKIKEMCQVTDELLEKTIGEMSGIKDLYCYK